MPQREIGAILMGVGAVVVIIGLIAWAGGLAWFGHLPGDVRIERENTRLYFPITSMILVSVVLTIVLNLVRRFL